jgi:hypothetical protein
MHLGREEHAQASKTRPELDSSTFAGRHRGALTVVELTDKRLVVGSKPFMIGETTETPRKQPRSGISITPPYGDLRPRRAVPGVRGALSQAPGTEPERAAGSVENFWSSEQVCMVRLVDRDAVMDKLVYTATNPVQDHLVDRVHHWPGVNGLAALLAGRSLRARRPWHFFRPDGPMPRRSRCGSRSRPRSGPRQRCSRSCGNARRPFAAICCIAKCQDLPMVYRSSSGRRKGIRMGEGILNSLHAYSSRTRRAPRWVDPCQLGVVTNIMSGSGSITQIM